MKQMKEVEVEVELQAEKFKFFGLVPGAGLAELRQAYLNKSSLPRLQKVILEEPELAAEFCRIHETFMLLARGLSEQEKDSRNTVMPREAIFLMLLNQGIYAMIKGNQLQAGEKLFKAQTIEPGHHTMLIYLAIVLMHRKNHYAAEKYLEQVIKTDPQREDAWYYLAENYSRAGLHQKAISTYEKARNLNPNRQIIAFRIKDCREALEKKATAGKKKSLVKKALGYLRKTFSEE